MKKCLQILLIISVLILTLSSCDIFKISFGEGNGENGGDVTDNENTEQGGTEEDNSCKHNFVIDEAKAPTCTEEGLTEGKHCTLCGFVQVKQEVVAVSHAFGEWEITSEGNCFIPGERKRVCSLCEYEDISIIASSAHSFVQDPETLMFSCEMCDARVAYGHLYGAINMTTDWFSAYEYCTSIGGHLATITTEREQAIIADMLEKASANFYWLGAIKNSDGWNWVSGEEFSYTNFNSGEPNNKNGNEMFIMVYAVNSGYPVGKWNDLNLLYNNNSGNLHNNTGFICEWELEDECSTHYFTEWEVKSEADCFFDGEEYRICTFCGEIETKVVPKVEHSFVLNEENGINSCEHCGAALYNGHIYKTFTKSLSWLDAYMECKKMGGSLAVITSEEEQLFLEGYMTSVSFTTESWIGMYYNSTEWQWVNGEEFEYTNWKVNEPNYHSNKEYFGTINCESLGKWNDRPPLDAYYFVCEFEYN